MTCCLESTSSNAQFYVSTSIMCEDFETFKTYLNTDVNFPNLCLYLLSSIEETVARCKKDNYQVGRKCDSCCFYLCNNSLKNILTDNEKISKLLETIIYLASNNKQNHLLVFVYEGIIYATTMSPSFRETCIINIDNCKITPINYFDPLAIDSYPAAMSARDIKRVAVIIYNKYGNVINAITFIESEVSEVFERKMKEFFILNYGNGLLSTKNTFKSVYEYTLE